MLVIYGYGITGKALQKYAQRRDIRHVIVDGLRSDALAPDDFDEWTEVSDVVVSPGISVCDRFVLRAEEHRVRVIGAFQYAYERLPEIKLISVTGTNGKSTVVTMITGILKKAGLNVFSAGNIGIPLISIVDQVCEGDIIVAELSSYQLEWTNNLKSDISILLNLTEDHLARHQTFAEYRRCKEKLIGFTGKGTVLYHPEFFSVRRSGALSLFRDFDFDGNKFTGPGILLSGIKPVLPGRHNEMNTAFAIMASFLAGADKEAVLSFLGEFTGLPHRLEYCGKYRNISFINDSKSTTFESTYAAVSSFHEKIVLIISGELKQGMDVHRFLKRLRHTDKICMICVFGDLAGKFRTVDTDDVLLYPEYEIKGLFRILTEKYQNERVNVLFSPGLPSFDYFRNFEHRGDFFKENIKGFLNEKKEC
ncbi:MAG: UDP-N-acetylmuramoyl-L-alanine--D-glutamate ligase [Candidatus Muiribacteriaceae bacterium]